MNGGKVTISVTCGSHEEFSYRVQRELCAKFNDMFERESLPLALTRQTGRAVTFSNSFLYWTRGHISAILEDAKVGCCLCLKRERLYIMWYCG